MSSKPKPPASLTTHPYLLVRTKGRPRFRRCGIDFGTDWLALDRKAMGPAIDERLQNESMLECKLATADEAEDVLEKAKVPQTVPELQAALFAEKARADRAEGELQRLTRGTHSPALGTEPPKDDDGRASTSRLP